MATQTKPNTKPLTDPKAVKDDCRIWLAVKDNPKRQISAKRFALYKDGMTVGAYRQAVKDWAAKTQFDTDPAVNAAKQKAQAGYGLLDVKWDMDAKRGLIEVYPANAK